MKRNLLICLVALLAISCSSKQEGIKVYGWAGLPKNHSEEVLAEQMQGFKDVHIKGLFYGTGFDVEAATKAAKAAKAAGLEFHTWVPTMNHRGEDIDSSWYAVSREGYPSIEKPAFVPYYTFLCPNKEEVYQYISKKYLALAAIPEVDGVHLDYVRYPDVILARGLWEKYGLTMDQEYAPYDYCYCDKCVAEFKEATGIDIKELGDEAQHCEEWKQFRYDVVTKFVNRIVEDVHNETGKLVSAAVFPGPSLAKKMVRQEWDKWNLDIFLPMNYNDFYLEGPEWVETITREGVEALDGKAPLYSGLFICGRPNEKANIEDPEGHGLVPSEIREAVEGAKRAGAEAVCVFVPNNMTPEHWAAIDDIIEK